jgi:hypothetical protein
MNRQIAQKEINSRIANAEFNEVNKNQCIFLKIDKFLKELRPQLKPVGVKRRRLTFRRAGDRPEVLF